MCARVHGLCVLYYNSQFPWYPEGAVLLRDPQKNTVFFGIEPLRQVRFRLKKRIKTYFCLVLYIIFYCIHTQLKEKTSDFMHLSALLLVFSLLTGSRAGRIGRFTFLQQELLQEGETLEDKANQTELLERARGHIISWTTELLTPPITVYITLRDSIVV